MLTVQRRCHKIIPHQRTNRTVPDCTPLVAGFFMRGRMGGTRLGDWTMIDSENNQSYKRILNAWFPTRVRLTRQYVAGTCAGFGLGLMVESAIVARGWHLLV